MTVPSQIGNKQNTVFDYIVALILFFTIIAIITRVQFLKSILYYILWLAVIFEVVIYGSQINDLLKPISGGQ